MKNKTKLLARAIKILAILTPIIMLGACDESEGHSEKYDPLEGTV